MFNLRLFLLVPCRQLKLQGWEIAAEGSVKLPDYVKLS